MREIDSRGGAVPGMRRILWTAAILTASAPAARAEMMLTSYYRAKASHIAAHRTLPIGTQLIVTNPRNGRSASVVIGGRGPFIPGRHLDVSQELARDLDFEKNGVVWLETRIVRPEGQAEVHQPHHAAAAKE
jgi:rare lipoprotein A